MANALTATPDGGYLVGGYTGSNNGNVSGNHGGNDFWIVKLDAGGALQWQKTLGSTDNDNLVWLTPAADGGALATGWTRSNGHPTSSQVYGNHGDFDVWVVRVDSDGNIVWRKSFGGCGQDEVRMAIETQDGGFVIAGGTLTNNSGDVYGSFGGYDAWAFKVDASGNLLWQRVYGGTAVDYFYAVRETPTGELVFGGLSSSTDHDLSGVEYFGDRDAWIVTVDAADGAVLNQHRYGGSDWEEIHNLELLADGGLAFAGLTYSANGQVATNYGGGDAWVARTDAAGNLLWERTLGGSANEYAYTVLERANGSFTVVGTTTSLDGDMIDNHGEADGWVITLDENGGTLSGRAFGGSLNDRILGAVPVVNNDDEALLFGVSFSNDGDVAANHGDGDFWIVRIELPPTVSVPAPNGGATWQLAVQPNPASNAVTVSTNLPGEKKLRIFNAGGQTVRELTTTKDQQTVVLESLPAGTYFIEVTAGAIIRKTRFVKTN